MSCAGGRRDDTRPRGVSAILVGMIGGVHPRDGESGAPEGPREVKSTLYTAYKRERERVAIEGGTQIGRGDFRGNVRGDSYTKVRACVRECGPLIVRLPAGSCAALGQGDRGGSDLLSTPAVSGCERRKRPETILFQAGVNSHLKIALGFCHILALTDKGKVYGWGRDTHGQLLDINRADFQGTEWVKSPSKIFIPNVKHVSDIAAMKYISAFKSSYDGRIYIQGCLHKLQLEHLVICEYTNIFDRYNSSFHSLEKNRTLTQEDENILDDLSNAFYDDSESSLKFTSDLTIEVNGEFIYVHKSILKMRSLYFKTMFEFNEVDNRKRIIKYDDYPYDTYKEFFRYLYIGWLGLMDTNQMIELLILADKYCVTNLEKECIKQLKIHMEPSTVSYIKEIAIMYNKTVAVYYLFFYYFFFKIKIIIYNELDILIQLNFNSLCFFYTFFVPVLLHSKIYLFEIP
ncbi:RCBT1 protein, partial [Acromyrmex heyeri]